MRNRSQFALTIALTTLFIFALTTCRVLGQAAPVKTSLCEALAHPAKFDGAMVKVRAKYSGTLDGTWLADRDCDAAGELMLPSDHELATQYGIDNVIFKLSKKYGFDDIVQDPEWKIFDASRRRLYTGLKSPTAVCVDFIAADFTGFLVIKRNFRIKGGFGNGWGHLGRSRFLLVLRSVSDVAPHACASRPTDEPPAIAP